MLSARPNPHKREFPPLPPPWARDMHITCHPNSINYPNKQQTWYTA